MTGGHAAAPGSRPADLAPAGALGGGGDSPRTFGLAHLPRDVVRRVLRQPGMRSRDALALRQTASAFRWVCATPALWFLADSELEIEEFESRGPPGFLETLVLRVPCPLAALVGTGNVYYAPFGASSAAEAARVGATMHGRAPLSVEDAWTLHAEGSTAGTVGTVGARGACQRIGYLPSTGEFAYSYAPDWLAWSTAAPSVFQLDPALFRLDHRAYDAVRVQRTSWVEARRAHPDLLWLY